MRAVGQNNTPPRVNDTKEEANADTAGEPDQNKKMLEWLKTPSGAYNLTLIIAIIAWLGAGVAIYAGFHLNKVRTIESQRKARESEEDKIRIKAELELATSKLEDAKAKLAVLEEKTKPIPLKQRLVICLEGIDRRIIEGLKAGTTRFHGVLEPYQLADLQKLAAEDAGEEFIRLKIGNNIILMVSGTATPAEFELKPALIQ